MFFLILFILLTLVSQVLLKKASIKGAKINNGSYIINMIKNPVVILAYSLSLINIFVWIIVLSKISLLVSFLSTSSLYILILFADYIFFKEQINFVKVIGACLIFFGIILSFI